MFTSQLVKLFLDLKNKTQKKEYIMEPKMLL